MRAMKGPEQIELTIRTASLVKSLTNLVGVGDARIARMMFIECMPQITALSEFIDKCNAQGKEVKP